MDAARYARIKALLHEAGALPSAARTAFLSKAAEADPEVVAEVRSLLEAAPVATRAVVPETLRRASEEAELPTGTKLGRYRVRAELGRGGMGVVYEADDTTTGRVVALKVVLPRLLALPTVRERFAREARLGALVAHENVVRTLDVGDAVHEGRELSFLVMERVHGKTLRRLLDGMGTVPEALLREIALQAARGLAALHAVGAVHRDLKPENVLLADDRRVRIMDLGVARVGGPTTALTEEGQFVGSLRYASPEQCRGGEIGPPADLYALGVVLFELATGRPPFEGDDLAALVRAHAEIRPAPIAALAPGLSEFLSHVVATLLEKEPARRFRSARELEDVLAAGERGGWWATRRRTHPTSPGRRGARSERGPCVGRDAELAALAQAFGAARGGAGRVVLLVGEPGTGKSRLLREAAAAAAGEDVRLLGTDASPHVGSTPLRAATLALVGPEPSAELARRLGLEPALAAAFAGWLRGGTDATSDPLPAAVTDGLLARTVAAFAADRPILWTVDDVHLADAESRRLLVTLARAIPGRPVLLVLAGEPSLDAGLAAALASLPTTTRLELGPLGLGAIEELARRFTGSDTLGVRIARVLGPRLDGVPRFVWEALAELERTGHLVRGPDGVAREAKPLESFRAPPAVRDLLRSRLAGLSLEERALLDAAAVAGDEFDPRLVVAVRGLPLLDGLEVLGRLERRHGLLRSDAAVTRFASRALHDVVHEDLPSALRAELHGRFADALEARPPAGVPKGALAVLVAEHRVRSAEPGAAFATVAAAVAEHEARGRPERAVDLARRALEVGDVPPALGLELRYRLGTNALVLSRHADVRAAVAEGIALAGDDGAHRARFRLLEAYLGLKTGDFAACLATATEILGGAAAARGRERRRALSYRGQALWCLGRLDEARETHDTARREAAADDDPVGEADAATNLAAALHELGRLEEAEATLRLALERKSGRGGRPDDAALLNLGNVLTDLGRRSEALALYERSMEACRAIGARESEEIARLNVGVVRTGFGDFEGAQDALRRAVDGSREIGSRRVLGYALHALAMLEQARGRREEARARYAEALGIRRELANRHALAETLIDAGGLAIEEGRFDAATTLLAEGAAIGREVGDPNLRVLAALHGARLPGADPAPAIEAFEAGRGRLRADRLVEALALRLALSPDVATARDAAAWVARALEQTPERFRASMAERVPCVRSIVEAATRLRVPIPPVSAPPPSA